VLGVVTTPTHRYPEGMTRVVLLGDPTKALGALAEPECARVMAAIELARQLDAPIEWFAVSAGAKIAMDSGTENMDWISRVLRGIIEFTQDGGEINVVVTGINVGAQPYWNAEATMLMHTKGILVMTPDSAMVLTGKQSLDYSGGVSAEDNFGIGGYDRIMGPNGQAQYWAPDLSAAVDVLLAHYEHTYLAPGERFPRQAPSIDPVDREIADRRTPGRTPTSPSSARSSPPRPTRAQEAVRRPLADARVADSDHPPLERWVDMHDADSVVCSTRTWVGSRWRCSASSPAHCPGTVGRRWTARPSGPPAPCSRVRRRRPPGRSTRLAGTGRWWCWPTSPVRRLPGVAARLQLEYGAEIGRAVVNFAGPIVFCVVSRYHGGAFVVFSGTLTTTWRSPRCRARTPR